MLFRSPALVLADQERGRRITLDGEFADEEASPLQQARHLGAERWERRRAHARLSGLLRGPIVRTVLLRNAILSAVSMPDSSCPHREPSPSQHGSNHYRAHSTPLENEAHELPLELSVPVRELDFHRLPFVLPRECNVLHPLRSAFSMKTQVQAKSAPESATRETRTTAPTPCRR